MEILIADDDVVSARVLRAALQRRGHAVTAVSNGDEAWRRLQERHFPIIISDWLMPQMDGLELCRLIRQRPDAPYTYVILLTAQSAREHRLEGLEAGADDLLTKPVDMGELSARLGIARRILTMQQDLHNRSVETERLNEQLQQRNDQISNTLCYLEAANHRFSELFEGLPVACYSYDADGCIHEWNRAAAELFGYDAGETFGRSIGEVLGRGEGTPADLSEVGNLTGVEVETRTRSGQSPHLLSKTIPLRAIDGQIVGMISAEMDITERRRLEEQLVTRLNQVTSLNAELEQFASIASHDLQEPLRKIQTFGSRLRSRYAAALGDQGQDYLHRMEGAASRMQSLIRDLFALSQVTSTDRQFVPVAAQELLRDVLIDLEARLEETGGRVEIGPLCDLYGDPVQLRQLLQNLIGNSLKYHRSGVPPAVRVSAVSLPHERAGAACRIEIADNGIGFEEEYLDRIFAPFQRLHGRSEYDGTGIGLAICRKIVERHEGAITARSRPGQGATFIVRLPCPATSLPAAQPLGSQAREKDYVTY